MHLITGYAGKEHVTSSDVGFEHSQVFGQGNFVFNAYDNFLATKIDNNTVRVSSGEGMMNGRHFSIDSESYEDIEIDNGVAGYNRFDLIVVRYEENLVSGVESCSLKVLKGDRTPGEPSDPMYTQGNIMDGDKIVDYPLYRVHIDDIEITAIERLFTPVDSIAETIRAAMDRVAILRQEIINLENSLANVATSGNYADLLGRIIPVPKTDAMTSAVGVDADGQLWAAGGGGGGTSGVSSVNGMTGDVELSAEDVGAIPTGSLADVATSGNYADLSGKPTFAKVATSGAYSDLSGKPTIPSSGSIASGNTGYATGGAVYNYCAGKRIVGVTSVTCQTSSMIAKDSSGTATGSFTAISGATSYRVIPISTAQYNIVSNNPTISGTTVSVACYNISGSSHTLTARCLVLGIG